jgi:hypothetical protein
MLKCEPSFTVNIFRLLLATTDPPPIRYSVLLPSSPTGRLEQKFFSPTDRVEQKTTLPHRQVRKNLHHTLLADLDKTNNPRGRSQRPVSQSEGKTK